MYSALQLNVLKLTVAGKCCGLMGSCNPKLGLGSIFWLDVFTSFGELYFLNSICRLSEVVLIQYCDESHTIRHEG